MLKRLTRRSLALVLSLACVGVMAQSDYPNKPIRMVVAWPPASGIDIVMRHITEALRAELGQPVIIENLGGAGGAIAAQKVLSAPADGYYIFQGSPNELILAPLAMKAVKYKPEDFRLIQQMALAPMAIAFITSWPERIPLSR